MGMCDVFNGNNFINTFKPSPRSDLIRNFTDVREVFWPKMINGTGKFHEIEFLLNIGDRSLASHLVMLPKRKSAALLAVNDWMSYFNVRTNHFQVRPGQRIDIVIQPTKHVATEAFRKLDFEDRKCFFRDEPEVRKMAYKRKILTRYPTISLE